jgi:hypothetical protein
MTRQRNLLALRIRTAQARADRLRRGADAVVMRAAEERAERGERLRAREREIRSQRAAEEAARELAEAQALQAQLATLPQTIDATIGLTRAIAKVAGIEPDHLFKLLADAYSHGMTQAALLRHGVVQPTRNPYEMQRRR